MGADDPADVCLRLSILPKVLTKVLIKILTKALTKILIKVLIIRLLQTCEFTQMIF